MGFVFKLTETKSILEKGWTNPIISDNLRVSLVGFYRMFLTTNVGESNNKFYYNENDVLLIPPDQYNLETIEKYIQGQKTFQFEKFYIKRNGWL